MKNEEDAESSFTLGNFQFELLAKGTSQFKRRYQVYHEGYAVAVYICEPYKHSNLPADGSQLKINNQVLYYNGIKEIIKEFEVTTGLVYSNITRCDLFIDTQRFGNRGGITSLFNNFYRGNIKSRGKGDYVMKPYIKKVEGRSVINAIEYGSRANMRFLRCYDKTLEMKEKEEKPHIMEMWKNNGYENESVIRFELQLRREFFENTKDFEFEDLFDVDGQLALMESACVNFFDLVYDTGKRVDRERPYVFLPWVALKEFYAKVVGRFRTFVREKFRCAEVGTMGILITARYELREWLHSGMSFRSPVVFQMLRLLHKNGMYGKFMRRFDSYVNEFMRSSPVLLDRSKIDFAWTTAEKEFITQRHMMYKGDSAMSLHYANEDMKYALVPII